MKTTDKITCTGFMVHLTRSNTGWRASIVCPTPGQVPGAATLELYRDCNTQHEALQCLSGMAETLHDPKTRSAARQAVARFLKHHLP